VNERFGFTILSRELPPGETQYDNNPAVRKQPHARVLQNSTSHRRRHNNPKDRLKLGQKHWPARSVISSVVFAAAICPRIQSRSRTLSVACRRNFLREKAVSRSRRHFALPMYAADRETRRPQGPP